MKKKLEEGKGELSIAKKDGDVDGKDLSTSQKKKMFEEAYKAQNPAKYELKVKTGEFAKQLELIN